MHLTGRVRTVALGLKQPCRLRREPGRYVYLQVSVGQWLAIRWIHNQHRTDRSHHIKLPPAAMSPHPDDALAGSRYRLAGCD
jgi:hypothetical protein